MKKEPRIDTNNCMNLTTRDRLLQAGTRLFAENGYRGASVRDICNLAGANPGAVSYHFGGKRQLYRSVLRKAAAGLADESPSACSTRFDGSSIACRRMMLPPAFSCGILPMEEPWPWNR